MKQLSAAAGQIRSYGSVAVLGAGLSATRFPMTLELQSLLWHAVDAVPIVRAQLGRAFGRDGMAKEIIGHDPDAVDAAWRLVEGDAGIRKAFQEAFARLDADREPSEAHYALARLIHAGLVEYVVSFNWDTALERAYEHLFGVSLSVRPGVLVKAHGDAARPDIPWVLPHEPGVVSDEVRSHIAELSAQRPRALIIVGYSGSDEVVVNELLAPAEARWPVIRIGPSVAGDESVTGSANEVMTALADVLDAPIELPGWRWVTFQRFRDLSAALRGYRLGPQDVKACPELPAVHAVATRLAQARFASIAGGSGCGKSIAAFQAARKLNLQGWTVVELGQPGVASGETVRSFQGARGPILAVVDDAQALSAAVAAQLERSVSADHAVLMIFSTEEPGGQEQVLVSASAGVAALRRYCLGHADVVLPLVAELDDRVGYGLAREPLSWRVRAAETAVYPWQFMFVLSGGERRIAEAIQSFEDTDEADDAALFFGVVAASQVLSLDAGVSADELAEAARELGHDERWIGDGLRVLAGRRLVIDRQGRIRTPHMRIAQRCLLVLCRTLDRPQSRELVTFLRSRLLDPTLPLQGKLWVLRAVDQSDPLRFGQPQMLLDESTVDALVTECLQAAPGPDRNIAAYLLWELTFWRVLSELSAQRVVDILLRWIRDVSALDVYGVASLLGGLRNDYTNLHAQLGAQVTPEAMAARLAEQGTQETGEHWGRLISELVPNGEGESTAWGARFDEAVDSSLLSAWASAEPQDESVRGTVELVDHLLGFAPRTATAILEAMSPALGRRFENDVAAASIDVTPWAFNLFPILTSVGDDFYDANPAYAEMRRALLDVIESTDWAAAGRSLSAASLYETRQLDLLTFSLAHFAPEVLDTMLAAVPLDHFDEITQGKWGDMAGIEHLVVSLAAGTDRQPARSWMENHRDEIQRIPIRAIPIAPRAAAEVIARGGHAELDPQGGLRWNWCAEALDALLDQDRDAAVAVVEASRTLLADGLVLRQSNMVEHLEEFIAVADRLDPGLLGHLIDDIDIALCRVHWPERLNGDEDEVVAVNLVIDRALEAHGDVAGLARMLRG